MSSLDKKIQSVSKLVEIGGTAIVFPPNCIQVKVLRDIIDGRVWIFKDAELPAVPVTYGAKPKAFRVFIRSGDVLYGYVVDTRHCKIVDEIQEAPDNASTT